METRTAGSATRRLLLTGGAGFIGSHFAEHCLQRRLVDRLIVLDAMTYSANAACLLQFQADNRFRLIEGNICDRALVEHLLQEEQIDCLVNLAAETHVDRSIQNSEAFLRSNVIGVRELLEAARNVWRSQCGPHRFHQMSTDEVFGPSAFDSPRRSESASYSPGSPYAASKAAADHLVMAWSNTYGIHSSISYCSNVFGPRQHPEKLIPMAIERLLSGQPIPIYGDGTQRRDWIHVRDVCRALELFLAGDTEGGRLFMGSEEERSNLEIIDALTAAAGMTRADVELRFVTDRPGHDRRYGLSSHVFRSITGFRESVALKDGLAETIDWYRARCTHDH